MAEAQTKDKPEAVVKEPTGAQRAKIATLTEKLGIETPEVSTQEDATKLIEELTRLSDESAETPGEPETPGPDEDEEDAEAEGEPAQPPTDNGLSVEETQKLFDRAVGEFGAALRIVFEVEELEPSQTPGIVGFVLPGFAEKLPHDNFTRCTTCNGYGKVLTGSMNAGNEERDCPDPRCNGLGYWQKPSPVTPQAPTLAQPLPAPANGAGEWAPAPSWLGDPNLPPQVTP